MTKFLILVVSIAVLYIILSKHKTLCLVLGIFFGLCLVYQAIGFIGGVL